MYLCVYIHNCNTYVPIINLPNEQLYIFFKFKQSCVFHWLVVLNTVLQIKT